MRAEFQGLGPSSTAFPGHTQGAGWEARLLGLELAPIWDPGTFKARTLAARPCHRAGGVFKNATVKFFKIIFTKK